MRLQYYFDRIYWKVRSWVIPQHKSLRNAIPRTWMDLDGVMESFLDAVIISFVEEEQGLKQIDLIESSEGLTDEEYVEKWGSKKIFEDYRDSRYLNFLKLRDAYNWVKIERILLEDAKNESFYEGKTPNYEKYTRIEKEIDDRNTIHYKNLVELRGYLWT